jgi:serine/threonine protein kinase
MSSEGSDLELDLDPHEIHLPLGRDGEYKLELLVARTCFSVVYAGCREHPEPDDGPTKLAFKFLTPVQDLTFDEIEIQLSLGATRYFLPIRDHFPFAHFHCLVFPYASKGCASCYAKPDTPEDVIKFIMAETLKGLKHMHDIGFVHCDVKLENILVHENNRSLQIWISDFGLTLRLLDAKNYRSLRGSAYYFAPEVVRGEGSTFVCFT